MDLLIRSTKRNSVSVSACSVRLATIVVSRTDLGARMWIRRDPLRPGGPLRKWRDLRCQRERPPGLPFPAAYAAPPRALPPQRLSPLSAQRHHPRLALAPPWPRPHAAAH